MIAGVDLIDPNQIHIVQFTSGTDTIRKFSMPAGLKVSVDYMHQSSVDFVGCFNSQGFSSSTIPQYGMIVTQINSNDLDYLYLNGDVGDIIRCQGIKYSNSDSLLGTKAFFYTIKGSNQKRYLTYMHISNLVGSCVPGTTLNSNCYITQFTPIQEYVSEQFDWLSFEGIDVNYQGGGYMRWQQTEKYQGLVYSNVKWDSWQDDILTNPIKQQLEDINTNVQRGRLTSIASAIVKELTYTPNADYSIQLVVQEDVRYLQDQNTTLSNAVGGKIQFQYSPIPSQSSLSDPYEFECLIGFPCILTIAQVNLKACKDAVVHQFSESLLQRINGTYSTPNLQVTPTYSISSTSGILFSMLETRVDKIGTYLFNTSLQFSINNTLYNTDTSFQFTIKLTHICLQLAINSTKKQIQDKLYYVIGQNTASVNFNKYTFQDPYLKYRQIYLNIEVTANSFSIPQNSAPYFSDPLADIIVDIIDGKTLIDFPRSNDAEGNLINIEFDYGQAGVFVTGSNIKGIEINPISRDVGTYIIKVTLTDLHPQPKSTKYQFMLEVTDKNSNKNSLENITVSSEELNEIYQLKIAEVTNQGLVTLKHNSQFKFVSNIMLIKSQKLIDFKLFPYEEEYLEKAPIIKDWNVKSVSEKSMKIQLEFNDPSYVSQSQVRPQVIKHQIHLRHFQFLLLYLPKFLNQVKIKLMQKIIGLMKLLQGALGSAGGVVIVAILTNTGLSFFLNISMKNLWNLVTTLQLITHLPLLNIYIPGNAVEVMKAFISISNLNLIPKDLTKSIFDAIIPSTDSENQDKNALMGYGSSSVLVNIGSVAIILIVLLIVFALIFILIKLRHKCKAIQSFVLKIKSMLFYGTLIQTFQKGYLCMCISTFLSFNTSTKQEQGNESNSMMTVLFALSLFILPAFFVYLLWKNFNKFEDKNFIAAFGSLFYGFKYRTYFVIQNRGIYFLRRMIYAILIAFSQSQNFPTLSTMLALNQAQIMILAFALPCHNWKDTISEFLNEASFYLITLSLIPLSDASVDIDIKQLIGWYIVFATISNILLNYLLMMLSMIVGLINKIRQKLQKGREFQLTQKTLNLTLKQSQYYQSGNGKKLKRKPKRRAKQQKLKIHQLDTQLQINNTTIDKMIDFNINKSHNNLDDTSMVVENFENFEHNTNLLQLHRNAEQLNFFSNEDNKKLKKPKLKRHKNKLKKKKAVSKKLPQIKAQ
eukprot:403339584